MSDLESFQHHHLSNTTMEGKVVALTGGASGIGLATAKLLSSRGATVCISDVSLDNLKSVEDYFNKLNAPFMITALDVSRRKEVDSWIEAIVVKYGRLDGAVNCAGVV